MEGCQLIQTFAILNNTYIYDNSISNHVKHGGHVTSARQASSGP